MADANPHTEPPSPEEVKERLEALGEGSLDEAEDDFRFGSSVPAEQQMDELDFIQMSGLTAPSNEGPAAEIPAESVSEDMDPEAPVSFYEEGVDDVDGAMTPQSITDAPIRDDEVLYADPSAGDSSLTGGGGATSAAAFKDIIKELSEKEEEPAAYPVEPSEDATSDLPAEPQAPSPVEGTGTPQPLEEQESLDPPAAASSVEAPDGPVFEEGLEGEASGDVEEDDFLQAVAPDKGSDEDDMTESSLPEAAEEMAESALEKDADFGGAAEEAEVADEEESPSVTPRNDLAEAEHLLQELEAQEDDATGREGGEFDASAESAEEFTPEFEVPLKDVKAEGEDDESVYNRPKHAGERRRKRRNISPFRRALRLIPVAVLLAGIGVGGYYLYQEGRERYSTPDQLYQKAVRLLTEDLYEEASDAFSNFSTRYRDHPLEKIQRLRAEAQFMAAYALQLNPELSDDLAMKALDLFELFILENEGHAKRSRAESLTGILHYKLAHYDMAVRILENPRLRIEDSDAYLPSLRALGHSYVKLAEATAGRRSAIAMDSGLGAFRTAVSLKSNFTKDKDHIELARIYENLAHQTPAGPSREQYRAWTKEQWVLALATPGLEEVRKRVLRTEMARRLASIPVEELGREEIPRGGGHRVEDLEVSIVDSSSTAGNLEFEEPSTEDEQDQGPPRTSRQ